MTKNSHSGRLRSSTLEQAVRHGFDISAVLAGSGLDHKTYAEPKTVLSQAQEFAIYANVSRLFATGDIGLRLGGLMTVNNFGLLGGLIANSSRVCDRRR